MTLSVGLSFIMAGAIVLGLFCWLVIVLRAGRQRRRRGPAQPNSKHREVMGGQFDASGGRQVTPRRDATPGEVPPPQAESTTDRVS
ncbi:MAG TPA: hypothetical protein VGM14_13435 [Streptosporangiaceae bacterium]|jgi:hypothetical protein